MPYENSAGLGVNNNYGVRTTGGTVGVETTSGSSTMLRIDLTGRSIADAIAGFVPPVTVPKGALFKSAFLRVDEAFVVTGTTPALSIGAVGSVGSNYFTISEAELETLGTKKLTSAGVGTWAFASTVGTAAAAKVAFALTGTTPVVATTSGKATLILEFVNVTKV